MSWPPSNSSSIWCQNYKSKKDYAWKSVYDDKLRISDIQWHSFKIISDTIDNGKKVIMGIEHNQYPCFGVQFHPESIATNPFGKKIIKNYLKL